MKRLLQPDSIAIVGLSADPAKHGHRVLRNLRTFGYEGHVWGVNPRQPDLDGVDVFPELADLPTAPDLVVSAVPAAATPAVAKAAARMGAGGVVVFAGGFAETGKVGAAIQRQLLEVVTGTGTRILGPNSGGIIRPATGLTASFLTCLDRPAEQIHTGPVGLVTQSGGTGSYLHNLAAASGSGLAASISTGNEADVDLSDGIVGLLELEEVRTIALVIEAVRNGPAFIAAVRKARQQGVEVVACRIGRSEHGRDLMLSHTGALASPDKVLGGVLESLGVTVAETPEEMLEVAQIVARSRRPAGDRVGIITHSGGIAILLSDIAERHRLRLPAPDDKLCRQLEPLLSLGVAKNPLDMGGIIGGPGRFAEAVQAFASSGSYDAVLAVTTAHPPAHTSQRVDGLLALVPAVPVVHLWMGGDQAAAGLERLRSADLPVTCEPRAAVTGMAALARGPLEQPPLIEPASEKVETPKTEHQVKNLLRAWGLPVVDGALATSAAEAAAVAAELGGEVVVKISSPDIVHKVAARGVAVSVLGDKAVMDAFHRVTSEVARRVPGARVDGVLVERMRSGFEVIVGAVRDPEFGPVVMVGTGGSSVEHMSGQQFAPAPVTVQSAVRMTERVPGLERMLSCHAVDDLAQLLSEISVRFVASDFAELELNPVAWSRGSWVVLDGVVIGSGEGEAHGQVE